MLKASMFRFCLAILLIMPVTQAAFASQPPAQASEAAQAATTMLDTLFEHNDTVSLILWRLYEKGILTVPPEQYKQLMVDLLIDMASYDAPEIAPGCLLPYTIAASTLLTYTPTMFILFLNELTSGDEECALMYGSWSIAGICFSLASWTQYRICAEQNSDTPDPITIARLQNDLTTMEIGTIAAAGSGLVFRTGCNRSYFKLPGLNRKKKR